MVNQQTVHNVAINIAEKYDRLLNDFNEVTLCINASFEITLSCKIQ